MQQATSAARSAHEMTDPEQQALTSLAALRKALDDDAWAVDLERVADLYGEGLEELQHSREELVTAANAPEGAHSPLQMETMRKGIEEAEQRVSDLHARLTQVRQTRQRLAVEIRELYDQVEAAISAGRIDRASLPDYAETIEECRSRGLVHPGTIA